MIQKFENLKFINSARIQIEMDTIYIYIYYIIHVVKSASAQKV